MLKKSFLITLLGFLLIHSSTLTGTCANVIVEANKQSYNGTTNLSTFEGNVKVSYGDITVKSPKAFLKTGTDGKPEFAKFVNKATAIKESSAQKTQINADNINYSMTENNIKALGTVSSQFWENKQPVATIKADTQELDLTTNVITASGKVSILYKGYSANAANGRMTVDASGKPSEVILTGGARISQDNTTVSGAKLIFKPASNELLASGSVSSSTILEDATKVTIKSDTQQFDKASNTLIASGGVLIHYKDYTASGPKAVFLPDEKTGKPNKIIFVGRGKITEGARQVVADKIEITLNPKNFSAEGNVRSQFTQIQNPTTTNKKK